MKDGKSNSLCKLTPRKFYGYYKNKKKHFEMIYNKKNKGKFIYISKKLKLKFIPFKLAKLIVELNQVSH